MTSTTPIPVQPVILCGGSGTRLWPLSRAGFPKQFLCLTGIESLFQQAARRLAGLKAADLDVQAPFIVTGEDHRFTGIDAVFAGNDGESRALLLIELLGKTNTVSVPRECFAKAA